MMKFYKNKLISTVGPVTMLVILVVVLPYMAVVADGCVIVDQYPPEEKNGTSTIIITNQGSEDIASTFVSKSMKSISISTTNGMENNDSNEATTTSMRQLAITTSSTETNGTTGSDGRSSSSGSSSLNSNSSSINNVISNSSSNIGDGLNTLTRNDSKSTNETITTIRPYDRSYVISTTGRITKYLSDVWDHYFGSNNTNNCRSRLLIWKSNSNCSSTANDDSNNQHPKPLIQVPKPIISKYTMQRIIYGLVRKLFTIMNTWYVYDILMGWMESIDITNDQLICPADEDASCGGPTGYNGYWICRTLYSPFTGIPTSTSLCMEPDHSILITTIDTCGCCPHDPKCLSTQLPPMCTCRCSLFHNTYNDGVRIMYTPFGSGDTGHQPHRKMSNNDLNHHHHRRLVTTTATEPFEMCVSPEMAMSALVNALFNTNSDTNEKITCVTDCTQPFP